MDNILFSIVVPVYNVEAYLAETVDAMLPQMQALAYGAELVLIDDGSTDGSGKLCDTYAEKFPEAIRVFHKENEGLLLTRRFGFQKARGKYIINCDSDDTLEPVALKKLAEVVIKTDADVVIFNCNSWSPPSKVPFSKDMFATGAPSKEAVYRAFFHHAGAVSMCGKAFKRSCLEMEKDYSRFYKKSFGEDTLQSAEIYSNGNSFVYINEALYNYRSGSGMTGKMNPSYFQDFTRINAELESYKNRWELEDFDTLVGEKVFINAARAITQSRFDRDMTTKERKAFMAAIREHEMLRKYEEYYSNVRPVLKRSYRILLDGLLKRQYRFIDLSLRIKNLLSR